MTWVEDRDVFYMCKDEVRKAKAKIEQDWASDMKNFKKGFYKYTGQKRKVKDNAPP